MIQSLTSFRFITAFMVFLFHCKIHLGWNLGISLLDKFVKNGATFMTGFFVLSGFIMTHVYQNIDFSKRSNIFYFYLKRFAKIYPTYAVVTMVYFLLFPVGINPFLRTVVNDLFLVQAFFPTMFGIGYNGGTWSLTVEMFLYLLFPFFIIVSEKSPKILIFAIILGFITSFNIYIEKEDYIYANPIFRISDFICGMGFYFIKDKFKNLKHADKINLLIFIVILLITSVNKGFQYMRAHFAIVPLFGLWIALSFHSKAKFYNNKILEYLGLISYSFYLWQFVAIRLGKKVLETSPDINIHLLVLAAFLVNIICSVLSYHILEERARLFIIDKYKKKQSVF